MTVFVILDSKGRLCFMGSDLEYGLARRRLLDLECFEVQMWEMDQTVFFGTRVAAPGREQSVGCLGDGTICEESSHSPIFVYIFRTSPPRSRPSGQRRVKDSFPLSI